MRLTKEQVSTYITNAFNSESMKVFIVGCPSRAVYEDKILILSKFLFSYLTATGDLSDDSMIKIINDFIMYNSEIVNDYSGSYGELNDHQIYFKNHIFPIILKKYREENFKDGELSIRDYISIYEQIYTSSRMNQFVTHSFPGTLHDEVNKNGLDISRELFKGEMQFLSRYGFRTVYQTGGLYLTDLSLQTIGYALFCPEKIRMSFSGLTDLVQQDTETLFDYHRRVIQQFSNIFSGDISGRIACMYLNRINNFYFSNNDCCVAVIANQYDVSNIEFPKLFRYTLGFSLSFKFDSLLRKDEKLKELFEKTGELLEKGNEEGIEMLEMLTLYMKSKYPNSEETTLLKQQIEFDFFDNLTTFGLNRFNKGNGEGFLARNGKISSDEISIARFSNPLVLYSQYKVEEQQINHNDLKQR